MCVRVFVCLFVDQPNASLVSKVISVANRCRIDNQATIVCVFRVWQMGFADEPIGTCVFVYFHIRRRYEYMNFDQIPSVGTSRWRMNIARLCYNPLGFMASCVSTQQTFVFRTGVASGEAIWHYNCDLWHPRRHPINHFSYCLLMMTSFLVGCDLFSIRMTGRHR